VTDHNPFGRHTLDIDPEKECQTIVEQLKQIVHTTLHRQGAVVGISGGIDSAVVLALSARAFGPDHILGVLLPENESSDDSARLALLLADQLGAPTVTENISGALQGFGCYERRDAAIQRVIPEYQPGWGAKITLAGDLLNQAALNVFRVTVTSPDGREISKRLPMAEFSQIVAASNFKQRSRMSMLYYHAELRNYAVMGTANKNEYDLGFFVKYGDGGVDTQPIGHLFKTQIYQVAQYLNIPEEIQQRSPTTDTYPGGSTQEEFFYRIPFEILDAVWLGHEQGVANTEVAEALGLAVDQVERIVGDIASKTHATNYLRLPPLNVNGEPVH